MQSINYCLYSPIREFAMSNCNAIPVDDRPDQPSQFCEYVDSSTLPSLHCQRQATTRLKLDEHIHFDYCERHFGVMVLSSQAYHEHLKKWDEGRVQ